MPKISIIVPVYNVEGYLSRCIDSILAQTFTDFELILVDDGSPDNCPQICDDYAQKDNRIKVIHKENGGLSSARNAGIDIVKSEFIMFIDSDDIVKENAVEVLLNLMIKYNCEIACGCFGKIVNGGYIDNMSTSKIFVYDNKAAMQWYTTSKYGYTAWNKIYKTCLFENVRYPKGRIYEDVATTYKLISKVNKLCFIDEDLFYYRIRGNSISHSNFSIKNFDEVKSFEEYYNYISENYSELEKNVRRGLLNSIYRNLGNYSKICKDSSDPTYINWFDLVYNNRFFMLKYSDFSLKEKIAFLSIFLGRNLYYNLHRSKFKNEQ